MFILSVRHVQFLVWAHVYQVMLSRQLASGNSRDYFNHQQSLIQKLTNESSTVREVLPVIYASSPVELKISVSLYQISNVDEVNQALRLNVWLRLYWNNPFLQWQPEKYGGIKSIHLNSELIWTPDISLYNKASLEEDIDILYKRLATKIIVSHDGNCTWKAPVTLLSQCKIRVYKFPFDQQECNVTLGSWTYTEDEINTSPKEEKVDLDNFVPNGEWEVLSALLKGNVNYYSSSLTYTEVNFRLLIKRRPLYFALNLIIPCALIALLSFTSFILPSGHGERMSLVITVLLANSVYMLIVSGSLPQNSDEIPMIGIYFLCIIIEIALCLFATCLTVKISAKKTEMPSWLEVFVNQYLARFVFLKSDNIFERRNENGNLAVVRNEKFTKIELDNRTVPKRENEPDSNQQEVDLVEIGFSSNSKEKTENELLSEVQLLADEVRLKYSEQVLSEKWLLAAKVLDRFFLYVFLLIYVILTGFLLGSM